MVRYPFVTIRNFIFSERSYAVVHRVRPRPNPSNFRSTPRGAYEWLRVVPDPLVSVRTFTLSEWLRTVPDPLVTTRTFSSSERSYSLVHRVRPRPNPSNVRVSPSGYEHFLSERLRAVTSGYERSPFSECAPMLRMSDDVTEGMSGSRTYTLSSLAPPTLLPLPL